MGPRRKPREIVRASLLRGESGRRDPFSWISRSSLLVPLSPPPHHAHSTGEDRIPRPPSTLLPCRPSPPPPPPPPLPLLRIARRGLLSFRDHRVRPDVDSITSGTRGQCAAERRAVTSGIEKVKPRVRRTPGHSGGTRSIVDAASARLPSSACERKNTERHRSATPRADRTRCKMRDSADLISNSHCRSGSG